MIYKYEECDLFCVPSSYYLVQCISADFAMGAGIAVQFNKHFNVRENLKRRYGNVIAEWDGSWTKGFCVQDGRVFNLVTKRNYFHKPTEETMRNALFDLREQKSVVLSTMMTGIADWQQTALHSLRRTQHRQIALQSIIL